MKKGTVFWGAQGGVQPVSQRKESPNYRFLNQHSEAHVPALVPYSPLRCLFFPPPVNQRSHWPFGFWTLSAIVFKYKWKNWHSDITAQTRAHFFWVHYYEMGPFSECCKHQVPNCDWTLELTERNRDRELHLVRALWLSFLGSATQGTSAGTVCTHSLQSSHSKFWEPLKSIKVLYTYIPLQTEVTINPSPSHPKEVIHVNEVGKSRPKHLSLKEVNACKENQFLWERQVS